MTLHRFVTNKADVIGPGAGWQCGKRTPRAGAVGSTCLPAGVRLAGGPSGVTLRADIAWAVAVMTESDPGVESEKASHNAPG